MLDFNDILSTPGYNIQQFYAEAGTTLLRWQTWKKPRGVNWVYMIGVGGGGSGATGRVSATTSGGGGGGGSAAQTTVLIPAYLVPDILYIQAGFGAAGPTVAASNGNSGVPSYVCIEPSTVVVPNMTFLLANNGGGGSNGGAAGGSGGAAGSASTIANMPLAGRGIWNSLVGQAGTLGGTVTPTAGTNLTPPTTGLMVTGGTGGGGCSATAGAAGGSITAITGTLGTDFFPLPIPGGAAASGATPATFTPGFISKNYLMNFGGTGGGGCSGSNAAGIAGAGGNGAPGCGGGGGGGPNSVATTVARGGNGGGGFVYIISW